MSNFKAMVATGKRNDAMKFQVFSKMDCLKGLDTFEIWRRYKAHLQDNASLSPNLDPHDDGVFNNHVWPDKKYKR